MFDVLADGALGLAEKLGELLLAEPDGLVLQPHIQLGAAVFGLVEEKLVHDFSIVLTRHSRQIAIHILFGLPRSRFIRPKFSHLLFPLNPLVMPSRPAHLMRIQR